MYKVRVLRLNKEVAFETVTFEYPNSHTLQHIMDQVEGDCFVDICRLDVVEGDVDDLALDMEDFVAVQLERGSHGSAD